MGSPHHDVEPTTSAPPRPRQSAAATNSTIDARPSRCRLDRCRDWCALRRRVAHPADRYRATVSFYGERILPHLVDRACRTAELQAWRRQVTAGLVGTVVEIGFGSGLNIEAYPEEVELVYAVEPAEVARRLAEPRIAAGAVTVEHIGLDGQQIPLADDSCDAALSTFTLCTIPDVDGALAELRRVVRPGGRLHFLEHGLSPDPGIAAWQRRLEPVQKRLAGGCHLTRDPAALVRNAGFELDQVSSRYGRGPKPWVWFTEGVARKPA